MTPPKHSTRRELAPELEKVLLYDVAASSTEIAVLSAETTKPTPKPHTHGVYVPMMDPYMLGSTDYSEALEFIDHIVCMWIQRYRRSYMWRLSERFPYSMWRHWWLELSASKFFAVHAVKNIYGDLI